MPLNRPTLNQLTSQQLAAFDANLPTADSRLPLSVLNIMATAYAGALHGIYGYIDYQVRQAFVTSAEGSNLDALHGAVWGVTRNAATRASGSVTITGTTGSTLPLGSLLQSASGTLYTTTQARTLTSTTATVTVAASEPGNTGNLTHPASLSLTTPVTGINASANTVASLGGGTTTEKDEAYRARIINRVQQAPHGGNANDYRQWALSVAEVTRAFVGNDQGAGTVTVRVMTDDTTANGIPTTATLDAVTAYIDPLKPITAELFVSAPIAQPINPQIDISPNTPELRTAITASLNEMLRQRATPGGTVRRTHLSEAISTTPAEIDHDLVTPTANVVATTASHIVTLGTITFGTL